MGFATVVRVLEPPAVASAGTAVVVELAPPIVVAVAVALGPVPTLFVAVTAKAYAVPAVRPETVQVVVGGVAVHVAPPGVAVTVYAVTAGPPLAVGAAHVTAAVVSLGTAETDSGAPGTT